ncbi:MULTISPECIES: D-alanyl-D-alanine carboxypeptidase family protein [Alphaproteobacteria]|uniref:serine-type D-Ala-D-Ala carboxypeptidase n=2 Tax=Alphaproteobacteria TaxID=28211 RepID=A0A512HD42_9HYPH|nr:MULTISPECIES: D-alanyl-D-alanine carboxypeptidase family protein [Alphaproteobacteria]GEO83355.1 D-alanyl-D-alanine carboxypeptidase [Ciceribacter naphthalenivorans]GLR20251.1 D-alanyl-D-alanine carboxypeptidase [Ciceribacter naphthalenivorans]GLT03107.1 D-alanyl-D-alanine carboxypeptidase [Sphingomonas psychrolutea]
MRYSLALAFLFVAFVLSTPAHAQKAPDPLFDTKAEQALLIEASTGTVLLSKKENTAIPPASLAKLMTLEVVFDAIRRGEIGLDTSYRVSEHAWRTGGAPSRTATMFAALKSEVRVEDLLKGIAVQMANDACIILAEGMEGSEEKFAVRMNERAKAIGLRASHFANSTGLPNPDNSTTLSDMILLARHLQQTYPELYRLFSLPDFEWNKIFQRNRNPLLGHSAGVDGLATGFAEESGYALVASAERDGRRLFLAIGGMTNNKERAEEASRLLDWGFSAFAMRPLFPAGATIGAASVYGGDSSKVDLIAAGPVDVYVATNDPERLQARIVYHWPLRAPVPAGSDVGVLRISQGARLLREVGLKSATTVGEGTLRQKAGDALFELLFFWL